MALFGDADPVDFPEVHRFNVPQGCHWRDVRETPANVRRPCRTPCARSSARTPITWSRAGRSELVRMRWCWTV